MLITEKVVRDLLNKFGELLLFKKKTTSDFNSNFKQTTAGFEHHYHVDGQHVNVMYTHRGKNAYDVDFKVNDDFSRALKPKFNPVTGLKILLSVRDSAHKFKKQINPHAYHFEAYDTNPLIQHYKRHLYDRAAKSFGQKYDAKVKHQKKKVVVNFKKKMNEEVEKKKGGKYKGFAEKYTHGNHNVTIRYDNIGAAENSYKVHFWVDRKIKSKPAGGKTGRTLLWSVLGRIKSFVKSKKPALIHMNGNDAEKDRVYKHAAISISREHPGSEVMHIPEQGSLVHFPQHINTQNRSLTKKE
jgi:hypothetical protein